MSAEKPIQSLTLLVQNWSKYLKQDLAKVILKKKIGITGVLASSIKYRIEYDNDGPTKVVFEFSHYGQFVDMGVGKGQKLGDVKGNTTIAKAIGIKGRRPKKWYSKTIYPQANQLSAMLREQYGINALDIVKDTLPNKINMNM